MSNKLIELESLHETIASDVYRMVDITVDKYGKSVFSDELEEAVFELSQAVQNLSDMIIAEADRNDNYFVKEHYKNA
jgi:hypothetical protein